MVDTGACIPTVDFSLARKLGVPIRSWEGEPLMSFTEQEALPIGAIDVTVTFGSSECNITAAVMLKSPYSFVLSKGWVELAQPDFSYREGKLVILPPG